MAHDMALKRGESDSARNHRDDRLADLGQWAAHYALAFIFLFFGASKFTAMAGETLAPLIMNSPLVSWMHALFGVDGAPPVLGVYEILTGLLIAARPLNPRLSAIGGAMGAITFLVTLSFLFSTPMVAAGSGPFPLTMLGQFLLKDLVLLGVALWIFAASRAEMRPDDDQEARS